MDEAEKGLGALVSPGGVSERGRWLALVAGIGLACRDVFIWWMLSGWPWVLPGALLCCVRHRFRAAYTKKLSGKAMTWPLKSLISHPSTILPPLGSNELYRKQKVTCPVLLPQYWYFIISSMTRRLICGRKVDPTLVLTTILSVNTVAQATVIEQYSRYFLLIVDYLWVHSKKKSGIFFCLFRRH